MPSLYAGASGEPGDRQGLRSRRLAQRVHHDQSPTLNITAAGHSITSSAGRAASAAHLPTTIAWVETTRAGDPIELSLRPKEFDSDFLALNKACFAQTSTKRLDNGCRLARRSAAQKSDHRHRRSRCYGPRRRTTAEQNDELRSQ